MNKLIGHLKAYNLCDLSILLMAFKSSKQGILGDWSTWWWYCQALGWWRWKERTWIKKTICTSIGWNSLLHFFLQHDSAEQSCFIKLFFQCRNLIDVLSGTSTYKDNISFLAGIKSWACLIVHNSESKSKSIPNLNFWFFFHGWSLIGDTDCFITPMTTFWPCFLHVGWSNFLFI